jgi:hypothetical protein
VDGDHHPPRARLDELLDPVEDLVERLLALDRLGERAIAPMRQPAQGLLVGL